MNDVQGIYERFRAEQEYRRFRALSDGQAWDSARRDLGYATELAWFTEVAETVVPPALVDAANATVTLCVWLLDIARPSLVWYRPETADEAAWRRQRGPGDLGCFQLAENTVGVARRDVGLLLLRADRTVGQTMTTAAHECRHLAQPSHTDAETYVANERDARDFASEFAAAYLTPN